jgi:manganese transport protein
MEGYLNLRIQPWLRRLLTRLIAIIPAFIAIYFFGEDKIGKLLVLSQVVLSLQLGFAVIPLIHFVSDKNKMKEFVIKPWLKIFAWLTAGIIILLNAKLVTEKIMEWRDNISNFILIDFVIIPFCFIAGILLLYITFYPFFKYITSRERKIPHEEIPDLLLPVEINFPEESKYKKIAVTVDFSLSDSRAVKEALEQGGKKSEYILIHVVETAGALMMNEDIYDYETEADSAGLKKYSSLLKNLGLNVDIKLGYGNPKASIPLLVKESNADLLVMGAHGHGAFGDLAFGTTLESVRHNVKIPVMIVRK